MPVARSILEHEWIFGAFLLLMWIRLTSVDSLTSADAAVFGLLLIANAAVVFATASRDTFLAWRLRLAFHPLAIGIVFVQMRSAVPAVNTWRADGLLMRLDEAILGATPSLIVQPFANLILSEFFSLCYLIFFPYLISSIVIRFFGSTLLLRKFCVGLFTVYAVAFLGYMLVPAVGPHQAIANAFTLLPTWKISELTGAVVSAGSNGVDVFPSLHCAVPLFLLAFDWRHRRRRFWLYLPWCIGIWCSTLYLRYDYFVDLVAGAALAVVAIYLAHRHPSCSQSESSQSATALTNQ
ncbi:MAG TPA: phosphatase PAP2 family protein [Burkholderiales bacterium]|nr:phosphatase PAP2 family protein [Burkholderiales bacterium]